jgi:hypothetical protein
MTPYSEVHVRAERMGETPATNLTRSGLEGGGAVPRLAVSSLNTVSSRLPAASGEVATLLNPLLKVRRSRCSRFAGRAAQGSQVAQQRHVCASCASRPHEQSKQAWQSRGRSSSEWCSDGRKAAPALPPAPDPTAASPEQQQLLCWIHRLSQALHVLRHRV